MDPSPMGERAAELVSRLELEPHPEGGHYREIYRSAQRVRRLSDGAARAALTEIYFLLRAGELSRWHRVLSEESWRWLEGAPLRLMDVELGRGAADANADVLREVRLGPVALDSTPHHVIAAGHWQAARSLGDYTLVTCAVAPGFDFEDFRLLAPGDAPCERLRRLAPGWPVP